jgi:hypothetical protein
MKRGTCSYCEKQIGGGGECTATMLEGWYEILAKNDFLYKNLSVFK